MLRYVELKPGLSGNGPAWIGRGRLSRSGRTVYFNGKALKRSHSQGAGSHYDLETGESHWVSEVKKNGEDRHRWGSGKVAIEAAVVDEYLELIGSTKLDKPRFHIVPGLKDAVAPTSHHPE